MDVFSAQEDTGYRLDFLHNQSIVAPQNPLIFFGAMQHMKDRAGILNPVDGHITKANMYSQTDFTKAADDLEILGLGITWENSNGVVQPIIPEQEYNTDVLATLCSINKLGQHYYDHNYWRALEAISGECIAGLDFINQARSTLDWSLILRNN